MLQRLYEFNIVENDFFSTESVEIANRNQPNRPVLQLCSIGANFPAETFCHGMDIFDEKDKVRLFETQEKNVRSIHDYAKIFLPIAVVVIVVLAAIMYLMSPGIGDTVRPSIELNDAVYDHMLTQEKRTANEIAFYKCDGYYWVKILAEPRAYPPSNLEDDVNQYRLTVREKSDGSRQIETLPLPSKENDIPCKTS